MRLRLLGVEPGSGMMTGQVSTIFGIDCPYGEDFDWTAILAFMAPRLIPGVETVEDMRYRRSFYLDGCSGWFEVSNQPESSTLSLNIHVEGGVCPQERVEERVRAMFDLDTDLTTIRNELARDPFLRATIMAHPGLRLPGAWDPFEFTVRAILGQQISVKAATTLAGRLATKCGTKCGSGYPGGLQHFFPTAEQVQNADLSGIGMTNKRQETILGLASNVAQKKVFLTRAQELNDFVCALTALHGIGPWTAHYVAMRALKMPDAFPDSDLGVRKALINNGRLPTPKEAIQRAETWRPWRAYATLYLWKLVEMRE